MNPTPQPPNQLGLKILNLMNKNVDPCLDFYEYSCGGWIANTSIPSDDVKGKLQKRFKLKK